MIRLKSDSHNESADDPIEDASPVELPDRTINVLSSVEEPQGPEASLVEQDLEGGGVLDEHIQTFALQTDGEADLERLLQIDLSAGGTKKSRGILNLTQRSSLVQGVGSTLTFPMIGKVKMPDNC